MQEIRVPTQVMSTSVELDLGQTRSELRHAILCAASGKIDKAKEYKDKLETDWRRIDEEFALLPSKSQKFVLQVNKDRVATLAVELPLLHQEDRAHR